MVLYNITTSNCFNQAGQQLFSECHEVIVVGVRHVKFHRRKLRVMGQVDAY